MFGPVAAVYKVESDEAIAKRLAVGMANVNTPAGEGAGFGRELGPLAMDEFVNKQMYFVAK